jgi:chemotaxis signal transduction protein
VFNDCGVSRLFQAALAGSKARATDFGMTMETFSNRNDPPEEWRYVVTFWLDHQLYAVPIESVIKISELAALIPGSDETIMGTLALEDRRVPVINLRRHRGMSEIQLGPHSPILTIQIGTTRIALIVDKIAGVLRLPCGQVARAAERLPGTLMSTAHGNTILLDLGNLFTAQQIETLTSTISAKA